MVDPAGAIGSNAAASTAGALYWLVIIRSRFALIEVAVRGSLNASALSSWRL
jgi:hypothetical protein